MVHVPTLSLLQGLPMERRGDCHALAALAQPQERWDTTLPVTTPNHYAMIAMSVLRACQCVCCAKR